MVAGKTASLMARDRIGASPHLQDSLLEDMDKSSFYSYKGERIRFGTCAGRKPWRNVQC
jgi:hypothetical protein